MVKLALYVGKGKIGNAAVRWWTRRRESHCELVVAGRCYSSSVMDHGVRSKVIDLADGKWIVVDLPWADAAAVLTYFRLTDSHRYGWLGLLWSQFFNRNSRQRRAQFCSEWCAAALGLPNPAVLSPAALGDLCRHINNLAGCVVTPQSV